MNSIFFMKKKAEANYEKEDVELVSNKILSVVSFTFFVIVHHQNFSSQSRVTTITTQIGYIGITRITISYTTSIMLRPSAQYECRR